MFEVDWSLQLQLLALNVQNFWKYAKGGPLGNFFFDFFLNTLLDSGWSYETIRMPSEGLKMFKSPKSIQCYPFAVVISHSCIPWECSKWSTSSSRTPDLHGLQCEHLHSTTHIMHIILYYVYLAEVFTFHISWCHQ